MPDAIVTDDTDLPEDMVFIGATVKLKDVKTGAEPNAEADADERLVVVAGAGQGKTEVVAPSSAPMLVIVAFPVHEIDSTPGPKYSTTR